MSWISDEIVYCRSREEAERAAVVPARNPGARDSDFMVAKRYAHQAYSLGEQITDFFQRTKIRWRLRRRDNFARIMRYSAANGVFLSNIDE